MNITQAFSKLFKPQPIIQPETPMIQAAEAEQTERTAPEAQEAPIDRMAREFFKERSHIHLVAIIQKRGNDPMASVTLYERGYGVRIKAQVHSGDRLELGVQELAQRFSNAKLEILYS
jgi:hypothetical protein